MNNIEIDYAGIFERCKLLSAFEGRQATSESGASLYKEVALTDGEKKLLCGYIDKALQIIESELGDSVDIELIPATTTTEAKAVLTWYSSSRAVQNITSNSALYKTVCETAVTYAMHLWLGDKLPVRATSYQGMFTDMVAAARKLAYKVILPTKKKRQRLDFSSEVEVVATA